MLRPSVEHLVQEQVRPVIAEQLEPPAEALALADMLPAEEEDADE